MKMFFFTLIIHGLDDLKKYIDIWLCFGGSFFNIENAEYYCGLGISVTLIELACAKSHP